MNINKYLDVNPEVAEAIANGKPVVALESTIISHGMPYPQNVETALNVERIIRENGAVPATIAINGKNHARFGCGICPPGAARCRFILWYWKFFLCHTCHRIRYNRPVPKSRFVQPPNRRKTIKSI